MVAGCVSKTIIVSMLDTIHGDICRSLKSRCDKPEFKQKLGSADPAKSLLKFKPLAEDGSTALVQRCRGKDARLVHSSAAFAEAAQSAATLPALAHNWVQWFLEDTHHRVQMYQFVH